MHIEGIRSRPLRAIRELKPGLSGLLKIQVREHRCVIRWLVTYHVASCISLDSYSYLITTLRAIPTAGRMTFEMDINLEDINLEESKPEADGHDL